MLIYDAYLAIASQALSKDRKPSIIDHQSKHVEDKDTARLDEKAVMKEERDAKGEEVGGETPRRESLLHRLTHFKKDDDGGAGDGR